MQFEAPDMHCRKCGTLIPGNGYDTDSLGNVVCDADGNAIHRAIGKIGCVGCAMDASKGMTIPKRHRRKRGDVVEEQIKIDAPMMFVRADGYPA